jgi:hypothetical protein
MIHNLPLVAGVVLTVVLCACSLRPPSEAAETSEPSQVIIGYDASRDLCSVSDKKAGTVMSLPCDKLDEYVRAHYPPGKT